MFAILQVPELQSAIRVDPNFDYSLSLNLDNPLQHFAKRPHGLRRYCLTLVLRY